MRKDKVDAFIYIAMGFVLAILIYTLYESSDVFRPSEFEAKSKENLKKPSFPIDIVYTWAGENNDSSDIRTAYSGEIKYSLRSIKENLPWANHIYILQNPGKAFPSWIDESKAKGHITVVTHDDTYKDGIDYQKPVTNSNSIETTLCNIPGLSEHFIYLNDDFLITRPLEYTDFFTESGLAKIQPSYRAVRKTKSTLGFKLPQITIGFGSHIPLPMRKSAQQDYNKEFSDYVKWIRSHKARKGLGCEPCTKNGLYCPCQNIHGSVALYTLNEGKAVKNTIHKKQTRHANGSKVKWSDRHGVSYFESDTIFSAPKLKKSNLADTICINDTESNPDKRQKLREVVESWLSSLYPEKAVFEKDG